MECAFEEINLNYECITECYMESLLHFNLSLNSYYFSIYILHIALGGTRTHTLLLRRESLYPIKLRGQI